MSSLPPSDGTHTVQISHRDGLAIMHFEKPVRWCALDPGQGAQFAEQFARACYAAKHGDTPTTEKRSQITEQIRVTLTTRAMHIINSAEREAPRPGSKILASRIVDECLAALA